MDPRDSSHKLPVPGAWQPPVVQAMNHLAERLGVTPEAVTVSRVEPCEWRVDGDEAQVERGLEIWLLGASRSYRYRAPLADGPPAPVADAS